MPYELLTNATPVAIIAILLLFLLKNYMDSTNKEKENYSKLVEDVRAESKGREDKLMGQLDKYNESLHEISENIKAIPKMQDDIAFLKEKVK